MITDQSISLQRVRPSCDELIGQHVHITRLDPKEDIDNLYDVSHQTESFRNLWRYMFNGPFSDKEAMYQWLLSVSKNQDPIFYTVISKALGRRVGIFSLMNIVPEMARIEFGNIWYSPLVQKTRVNTEVTYLFLRYMFDELKYRRVEWKCDNRNEPSKKTALRMGFTYEGLFRKHMIVKKQNRDTAWFSIVDDEWPQVRANFEAYLADASASISLAALNQK